MKFILVVLSVLSGSLAYANFSGVWQGEAIATTSDGKTFYCDEIILNVSQTPSQFEFGNFRYACGEFAINFHPPVLKVLEGGIAVMWKEQNVGKVTSDEAHLLFLLESGGKARYTAKKVSEKEMDYLDEQIGTDQNTGKEIVTSIKAKLYRVK